MFNIPTFFNTATVTCSDATLIGDVNLVNNNMSFKMQTTIAPSTTIVSGSHLCTATLTSTTQQPDSSFSPLHFEVESSPTASTTIKYIITKIQPNIGFSTKAFQPLITATSIITSSSTTTHQVQIVSTSESTTLTPIVNSNAELTLSIGFHGMQA